MAPSTPPQEPVAFASVCDHHYATRLRGGDPITVRICTLCHTPDWDDLADQAAALYRKGREASEAAAKDARKSRRMADQVNLDAHRRFLDAGVETLQKRLRLAHQARLAKVRQLDNVRHALIETGLIEEDDPYGHADLADVIRQVHTGDTSSKETIRDRIVAELHRRQTHYESGQVHEHALAQVSGEILGLQVALGIAFGHPATGTDGLKAARKFYSEWRASGKLPPWARTLLADSDRPEPAPAGPATNPDHGPTPPRAIPASPQWSPGDGHKRCPFTRNTAGGPVRCIFRDGHPPHGHTLPGEQCCVCGSTAVVYWNYRDLPFCGPCADGDTPTVGKPDPERHARYKTVAVATEEIARLREELKQRVEAVDAATRYSQTLEKSYDELEEERNRIRAELAELRRDADDAHARVTALETTLSEVLATFTHKTHPGRACLQSEHVPVGTVERWETVLHGIPEPDTAPLCGCGHRKSQHGEDPVLCRDCPPGRGPMSLAEHFYQPAQEG